MGHARCGTLPDTKPWRETVGHLADGASAAVIAGAASRAAVAGFELALRDRGLSRVVFLLAQTSLASREDDFASALARIAVIVPPSPVFLDLTAGITSSLQRCHSETLITRTDLGPIGEQATSEASVAAWATGASRCFYVRGHSARHAKALDAEGFLDPGPRVFLAFHPAIPALAPKPGAIP